MNWGYLVSDGAFLESQLDQELDYQNHGYFIADGLLAENQLAEKD